MKKKHWYFITPNAYGDNQIENEIKVTWKDELKSIKVKQIK